MFTRSHTAAACAALAMLAAALLAGCSTATQSSHPRGPTPIFVAKPAAPPVLNLCADPSRPPDAIASKPGYTQMTVLADDQTGQPITGLAKYNFLAWTGKQNLPIVFFRGDRTAAPVSVVMVIDLSATMGRKIGSKTPTQLRSSDSRIDAAVAELNRCDEAAIVTSGGVKLTKEEIAEFTAGHRIRLENVSPSPRITVLEPFTTAQISPMKYLDQYTLSGKSSIYDAIDHATRMLANAHYRRRAIIVMTDGLDNASETTLKQTIAAARRRGVRIFVVGTGNPAVKNPMAMVVGLFMMLPNPYASDALDQSSLQSLAAGTSGTFLIAQDINNDDGASLAAALRKIIDALGGGYTIGVLAPSPKGSEPLLPSVGIVNQPHAIVHAYAEPPAQPHPPASNRTGAAARS